jgi:hypothetical protein
MYVHRYYERIIDHQRKHAGKYILEKKQNTRTFLLPMTLHIYMLNVLRLSPLAIIIYIQGLFRRNRPVFAPSPKCNFGPKGTLKKVQNNAQLM